MTHLEPLHLALGPAILPDAATGIFFHCILAWPTSAETVQFHRVADEMIAGSVRLSLRKDPEGIEEAAARWPHLDWPSYIRLARSKRRVARGTMERRIRHRMAAARMAIGILHEEIFGLAAELPSSMTSLSLDQLSELVRPDTRIADPENVEKLAWRSSLPIIHLAMATAIEMRVRDMRDGGPAREASRPERFDVRIDDIDFYRSATTRAATFEPMVQQHHRFKTVARNLTQVRWLE